MTRLSEAVEALARALGLWSKPLSGFYSKWTMQPDVDGLTVFGPAVPEPPDGEYGYRLPGPPPYDRFRTTLTPHDAMLWLRCYLLGTTRVRCPDCEERGGPMEWEQINVDGVGKASDWAARKRDQGWSASHFRIEGYRYRIALSRPCPTCTGPAVECKGVEDRGCIGGTATMLTRDEVKVWAGMCRACNGKGAVPGKPTGHVDRSWAEVFLRAMPTPSVVSKVAEHWGNVGQAMAHMQGETVSETPGDPGARERLTRLADQLQAQAIEGLGGDSPEQHPDLGVWLALWLGQQKCDACKGEGEAVVSKHASLQAYLDTDEMIRTARTMPPGHRVVGQPDSSVNIIAPCPACDGSGLALGSHSDAMADAAFALAEGLTAQAVAS